MLVIKAKGKLTIERYQEIREDIKLQMSEGLIVHDDTIEIYRIDNMCEKCGSNHLEYVKLFGDAEEATESVIDCLTCGNKRDLMN